MDESAVFMFEARWNIVLQPNKVNKNDSHQLLTQVPLDDNSVCLNLKK